MLAGLPVHRGRENQGDKPQVIGVHQEAKLAHRVIMPVPGAVRFILSRSGDV